MYNLTKNNYHLNPKNSDIQTPHEVSKFIFELFNKENSGLKPGLFLDPCSGTGNLLKPWKGLPFSDTLGIDIDKDLNEPDIYTDFLKLTQSGYENYLLSRLGGSPPLSLVLCNPPFNGYGHKLGSEV
jgi:hypothetical protein